LSYADLKRMARQSLEHSFLPGQSLWTDTKLVFRMAPACAGNAEGSGKPSAACEEFLSKNERARMQWKLESEFAKFEKNTIDRGALPSMAIYVARTTVEERRFSAAISAPERNAALAAP
jgi:hypothetical protein